MLTDEIMLTYTFYLLLVLAPAASLAGGFASPWETYTQLLGPTGAAEAAPLSRALPGRYLSDSEQSYSEQSEVS